MTTPLDPAATLRALRNENIAFRRHKDNLQRENEELRKHLRDFESTYMYSRNMRKRELQIENEMYRTQNNILAKEIELMRSERGGICRERENMVKKSNALKEALSNIEILNKQKTDLESEKQALHQTIENLNLNSKKEKEILVQQCNLLQNQVLQQEESLQDREVARLKMHTLTEENKSLRIKTIKLQMENHHMIQRFQYEKDLRGLQKLCVKGDVQETPQNPQEQSDDHAVTLRDGEEKNTTLQEEAQVRILVQKYEQIFDELRQENQSVHQRNGDLEKEVEEVKRTVGIETTRPNFEMYQQDVEERNVDGEDASLQKNVACHVTFGEHEVVQQELEHNLSQDYSWIQPQTKALEQEVQEVKDPMLHVHCEMGNETLPGQNSRLQLKDFERLHHEVTRENESLHEQNEALDKKVQELTKQLRDGEEAKRRDALAWPQEVQEFKSILAGMKVFQGHNDTLVSESESLTQRNKALEQELREIREMTKNAQFQVKNMEQVHDEMRQPIKAPQQEMKEAQNMTRIEKGSFAVEQIKACQNEDALTEGFQTLNILLKLKMKEIDKLRTEVLFLKTLTPKSLETPTPKSLETPTPKSLETPTPKSLENPTPKSLETPTSKSLETPTPKSLETPTPKSLETPTPKSLENPTPEARTPWLSRWF